MLNRLSHQAPQTVAFYTMPLAHQMARWLLTYHQMYLSGSSQGDSDVTVCFHRGSIQQVDRQVLQTRKQHLSP